MREARIRTKAQRPRGSPGAAWFIDYSSKEGQNYQTIWCNMSFTKETAVEEAKRDLAGRLGVPSDSISVESVSDKDFPDMSLGSPAGGEMSAQMISSGWQIKLGAGGNGYEYRADKYQLRLHNFKGTNYVVKS